MNLTQHQNQIPRKPAASESLARYSETVTIPCEDCQGSGEDRGALDFERPVCPSCKGVGTETVTRNYLSEAFSIAANPESKRVTERAHLVAVIRFAREHVSALIQLPEVA